jgi:ATP-dependent Clp protease ATP-binding subunit ClpA
MSVSGQRICRLAEEAADAPDPERALETLTELRRELGEFERQQVARALSAGRSFGTIAAAMGVTRQAVHRRFRDLTKRRRMEGVAPSPEVRLAVEYAGEEAKRLGATGLAPAHVVLGILRTGDRRAAAALTAAGVELEACRRAASSAGAGGEALRALLAESVQWAKRAGRDRIEIEHVLRSALREQAVADLLGALGITPERVRRELDAMPEPQPDCLEA